MSTKIFESELELSIEAVTISPFRSRSGDLAGYPMIPLVSTDEFEKRKFTAINLQNKWLEICFLPDLGGRIWSILDRRTGEYVWDQPVDLRLERQGLGRPGLAAGAEFMVGDRGRPGALGRVDFRVRDAEADDAPAAVILHELVNGQPLSWQACLSLAPDRAEVAIEFKLQNRSLVGVSDPSGMRIPGSWGDLVAGREGYGFVQGAKLGMHFRASAVLGHVGVHDGVLTLGNQAELAPRQVRSWRIVLSPMSLEGRVFALGDGLAISRTETSLCVATSATRLGGKLFILPANAETLESSASLHVESPSVFEVGELINGLRGVAVRDASGTSLLNWTADESELPPIEAQGWSQCELAQELLGDSHYATNFELESLTDVPGYQAAAHVVLAQRAIREQDWQTADRHLESALATNAEDVLVWWLKAVVQRHANSEQAERTELLNAHYLSPLEPALRMESFLAQPAMTGKEANPIFARLAEDPDSLLDVVCMLIEAGLDADASRAIDEALRHRENGMLRYLLAWSLLTKTRMAATAAEQVAAASALPLEPPFPWRPLEREAVQALHHQFPDDRRLADLCQLMADADLAVE